MVKFNVIKKELQAKGHKFTIPIRMDFENYEGGMSIQDLEAALISSPHSYLNTQARVTGNHEIEIEFTKEDTPRLSEIIKKVQECLKLIIADHAKKNEAKFKLAANKREKERQDLAEVNDALNGMHFE